MSQGYTPRTVPTPLFIAGGLALFILLMYLVLFLVSRTTKPAAKEPSPYYEPSVPYYEPPPPAQTTTPDRPWWEGIVQQEEKYRQEGYDALQRQDFDTDRRLEKFKQDREFYKMQHSVSKF